MIFLIKLARKVTKILNGAVAPWQIGLGVACGTALAALPISQGLGPAPLGCLVLLSALVFNAHLGCFFLAWGFGKAIAWGLAGLWVSLGSAFDGVAQSAAFIPLLYASGLSDTAILGRALVALPLAPILGIAAAILVQGYRLRLQARIAERKRLVTAGKTISNPWVLRLAGWLLDV